MLKRAFAIFIVLITAYCLPLTAMTRSEIEKMNAELFKLVAPYNGKVGVCFIDLKTGLKASYNGKKKFPAASVIKLGVMAAAYHMDESGILNLSERKTYMESDKLGGSGVLQWMKPGNSYTLWNLNRLMITLSDNIATKMLVDRIGTPEINSYLSQIGLADTVIVDNTCLNEPPQKKINYTSPQDMALLCAYIVGSSKFSPASSKEMIGFMKYQRYRWGIWRGVPKGIKVADKTGNVEGVLNDTGIVFAKRGNFALSIFTNGFKKKREARILINMITEIVYRHYDQ